MNKETANYNDVKGHEELRGDAKKDANSKFGEAATKFGESKSSSTISNENIKEVISKVMEDFSKFLEEKKEHISETASAYTNKYAGRVRRTVKDNPLYVVAGALTAGAILGAICKRNNSNS